MSAAFRESATVEQRKAEAKALAQRVDGTCVDPSQIRGGVTKPSRRQRGGEWLGDLCTAHMVIHDDGHVTAWDYRECERCNEMRRQP